MTETACNSFGKSHVYLSKANFSSKKFSLRKSNDKTINIDAFFLG